jgi:futalosine hydrolase
LIPTSFEAGLLFGEPARDALTRQELVKVEVNGRRVAAALCGFGLAAAGTGAAHALSRFTAGSSPPSCIMAGVAGTYHPRRAPVGSALLATHARSYGIGAGSGRSYAGAEEMGWPQGVARAGLPEVYDCLPLSTPDLSGVVMGGLLSVAAASGSRHEAQVRARRFPDALAEDMEAFAVGLAARLAGATLTVIRGISNVAGARDKDTWRLGEAAAAARGLLARVLERQAAVDGVWHDDAESSTSPVRTAAPERRIGHKSHT